MNRPSATLLPPHTTLLATLSLAALLLATPGLHAQQPARPAKAPLPVAPRVEVTDAPLQGPPWLGVALAEDDAKRGVGVERVMEKTPAARAGVKAGDRIVAIEGEPATSAQKVQVLTAAHRPGDKIALELLRGGRPMTLKVTLEEKPSRSAMVERQLLGRPAPNFEIEVLGGGGDTHKLAHWRGKPTIVEFWATWCGPCRVVSRDLAALKKAHGDDIHVVAVSSEPPEVIRAFLKHHEAPYPVGHDIGARGHDDFWVSSFPMVVLLDAEHRVSAVLLGTGHRRALASKLQTLVDESRGE